mmetsp:Transcript_126860/g.237112  ORF Transcript_126860/g.237112 Transcript_126860/m.237112 type:complete len:193 (+) Transcript_126860:77-655(+)
MGNSAGAGLPNGRGMLPMSLKMRSSGRVKRMRQSSGQVPRKSSLRRSRSGPELEAAFTSVVSSQSCADSSDFIIKKASRVSFDDKPAQIIECMVHKPMLSLAKYRGRKRVHTHPAFADIDWTLPDEQMWMREARRADEWSRDPRQNNYTWHGLYPVSCNDGTASPQNNVEDTWSRFEQSLGISRSAADSHSF